MIKIQLNILIASVVLLLLSLMGNYAQYGKAQASHLVIASQEVSIKDLKKQINHVEEDKKLAEASYDKVLIKTKESEISFNKLSEALSAVDCQEGKTNDSVKTPSSGVNLIDPDVTTYYNILHSAYSLQNAD